MAAVTIRPLTMGEEDLFESLSDPLPHLRKISYADGLAMGGFHPDRTWVALRDGEVVARAAWVLPPGSVGEPWLERFDVLDSPEVGAELLTAAHEALGGPKIYYAALPGYWRRMPDVLAAIEPAMAAARLAGLVQGQERHRFTWAGTPVPERSRRWTFRPAASAGEVTALVSGIDRPAVLTGMETAGVVRGIDLAVDPLGWLDFATSSWLVAIDGDAAVGVAGATMEACFAQIAYLG
ncbi:acetyltransferase, partial [Actinoplanes sp. TFC3]|uniref:acetyltransferase n=1 Tax=Actinoplanes sp. TFC3 TaxID=1710355 RepID=UPI000831F015